MVTVLPNDSAPAMVVTPLMLNLEAMVTAPPTDTPPLASRPLFMKVCSPIDRTDVIVQFSPIDTPVLAYKPLFITVCPPIDTQSFMIAWPPTDRRDLNVTQ